MRRNESKDFVGIDRLKARHTAQVDKFEEWAQSGQWTMFHHSHYDWSVREYAVPLIHAGLNFMYHDRDCAAIFLN